MGTADPLKERGEDFKKLPVVSVWKWNLLKTGGWFEPAIFSARDGRTETQRGGVGTWGKVLTGTNLLERGCLNNARDAPKWELITSLRSGNVTRAIQQKFYRTRG